MALGAGKEADHMRPNLVTLLIGIIAAIAFSTSVAAQEPAKQEQTGRPRQAKPSQKPPAETSEKTEAVPVDQEQNEAMRSAITNLSTQIGLLTGEVSRLRRETERNSGMMELLLNEDRLAKLEDKIAEAVDRKAQLEAREQDIGRRMRNIQGELIFRGGLRRDEAETAIRNDLQRLLDDVRSQQAAASQRVAELNEQAVRLRARVETLRKKLESEVNTEKEQK
jgi:ATP-dependent Lon protease